MISVKENKEYELLNLRGASDYVLKYEQGKNNLTIIHKFQNVKGKKLWLSLASTS